MSLSGNKRIGERIGRKYTVICLRVIVIVGKGPVAYYVSMSRGTFLTLPTFPYGRHQCVAMVASPLTRPTLS